MHGHYELAALDLALHNGGELAVVRVAVLAVSGDAKLRSAAHDLRPWAIRRRRVVAIAVLVGGDDELHTVLLQNRSPEVMALLLPVGEVRAILAAAIVGDVARMGGGISVEDGDVEEGNGERGGLDVGAIQGVGEPGSLGHAIRLGGDEAVELRVAVGLVLARVEPDCA